jgi:hypothetical protein
VRQVGCEDWEEITMELIAVRPFIEVEVERLRKHLRERHREAETLPVAMYRLARTRANCTGTNRKEMASVTSKASTLSDGLSSNIYLPIAKKEALIRSFKCLLSPHSGSQLYTRVHIVKISLCTSRAALVPCQRPST